MPYASHPIHFPDHAFPAVVDGWFYAMNAVERLEALMSNKKNFDRANAMVNARTENARLLQAGFDPFNEFPHTAVKLDPAVKSKRDAKRKAGRKTARKAREKKRWMDDTQA